MVGDPNLGLRIGSAPYCLLWGSDLLDGEMGEKAPLAPYVRQRTVGFREPNPFASVSQTQEESLSLSHLFILCSSPSSLLSILNISALKQSQLPTYKVNLSYLECEANTAINTRSQSFPHRSCVALSV